MNLKRKGNKSFFVNGFLEFLFSYKKSELKKLRIIETDELNIVRDENSQSQETRDFSSRHSKQPILNKVIITINYILAAVFVISFIIIALSALFIDIKNETAFDLIQNTFSLILGWFGNSLLVYLGAKDA